MNSTTPSTSGQSSPLEQLELFGRGLPRRPYCTDELGTARSTSELLRIAETIEEKNAGLQSIAEPWADTTSPAGRMVLTVFAGIAEFERSLIATRTEEGRRAAQARGVPFGRPPKLRPDQRTLARQSHRRRKIRQRSRPDLQCPCRNDLSLPTPRGALMTVLRSARTHGPSSRARARVDDEATLGRAVRWRAAHMSAGRRHRRVRAPRAECLFGNTLPAGACGTAVPQPLEGPQRRPHVHPPAHRPDGARGRARRRHRQTHPSSPAAPHRGDAPAGARHALHRHPEVPRTRGHRRHPHDRQSRGAPGGTRHHPQRRKGK